MIVCGTGGVASHVAPARRALPALRPGRVRASAHPRYRRIRRGVAVPTQAVRRSARHQDHPHSRGGRCRWITSTRAITAGRTRAILHPLHHLTSPPSRASPVSTSRERKRPEGSGRLRSRLAKKIEPLILSHRVLARAVSEVIGSLSAGAFRRVLMRWLSCNKSPTSPDFNTWIGS